MLTRIGIVDDKQQNRSTLRDELSLSDNLRIVLLAKNGVDFLQQMKELGEHERPQVVLMDIEMPEMDGYILTKKIKSDPRFNGVPVIMHSSLSGMSNQKLGSSVGVDEYVPKFEPQRLSETLARRLGVDKLPVKAE